MPKSVYTSDAFLALEQRHIFAAEWLRAGLSEPGPLSHIERPNWEFARYIASCIPVTAGTAGD